ncbi:MAG: hypothetical protein ACOY93_13205 [Bacillota bacterium]
METSTRGWIILLLVSTLLLQVWSINRQGRLERGIERVSTLQNQVETGLQRRLDYLQSSLRQMEEAERWMAVTRERVEPDSTCQQAEALIEWELRRWVPGTTSRLLYRTGAGEPWQEAPVRPTGGQNYQARLPVAAAPILEPHLSVNLIRPGRGSSEAGAATAARTKQEMDFEYQILAEGPEESRSSGLRRLPLRHYFTLPVRLHVRVEPQNRYWLSLSGMGDTMERCTRLEGAEVRAYSGERLVMTSRMESQAPGQWVADWRSEEALTRLDVLVRYGGREELVPISLPDR